MLEKNSDLSEHFGKNNKQLSENNPEVTVKQVKADNAEDFSEKTDTISDNERKDIENTNNYLNHNDEYYDNIRQRMRERKILAEKRRVRNNRIIAVLILIVLASIIYLCCFRSDKKKTDDSSNQVEQNTVQPSTTTLNVNSQEKKDTTISDSGDSENVKESSPKKTKEKKSPEIVKKNGMTFVNGILIVNKTYTLPSDYNPGTSQVASDAFNKMSAAAENEGIHLFINSGYRSYYEQKALYDGYVAQRGTKAADEVSSRPGHSEHQTGLTFDVNSTEFSFENTAEAKWLAKHCCEYGFIIRYPKGKEKITGYAYEPWHIRYLGVETATKVTKSGLCLEEYLGITSDYKYCKE